jgi:hypothetical protein
VRVDEAFTEMLTGCNYITRKAQEPTQSPVRVGKFARESGAGYGVLKRNRSLPVRGSSPYDPLLQSELSDGAGVNVGLENTR